MLNLMLAKAELNNKNPVCILVGDANGALDRVNGAARRLASLQVGWFSDRKQQ